MSKAKRPAPTTVGTLESVQPGDSAVLESGATVEVGFFLGASCFVRFSDNNEPRVVSSLPSGTKVFSVIRRSRVPSAAEAVTDPMNRRGK